VIELRRFQHRGDRLPVRTVGVNGEFFRAGQMKVAPGASGIESSHTSFGRKGQSGGRRADVPGDGDIIGAFFIVYELQITRASGIYVIILAHAHQGIGALVNLPLAAVHIVRHHAQRLVRAQTRAQGHGAPGVRYMPVTLPFVQGAAVIPGDSVQIVENDVGVILIGGKGNVGVRTVEIILFHIRRPYLLRGVAVADQPGLDRDRLGRLYMPDLAPGIHPVPAEPEIAGVQRQGAGIVALAVVGNLDLGIVVVGGDDHVPVVVVSRAPEPEVVAAGGVKVVVRGTARFYG